MCILFKIEIKFGKLEVRQIVRMLKFPDFIIFFLLPNLEKIKSVKLKIKFLSPMWTLYCILNIIVFLPTNVQVRLLW